MTEKERYSQHLTVGSCLMLFVSKDVLLESLSRERIRMQDGARSTRATFHLIECF